MAGKLKIVEEPLRSQFAQAAAHGGRQDVMALMQQFIDKVGAVCQCQKIVRKPE
jgi:hypothetical protein